MTLEEFAKQAGCIVSINPNPEGWEGEWMYTSTDWPDSYICGLKTEATAYKHWFVSKFGKETAKTVIKLLNKTEAQKAVMAQKKSPRPAVRLSAVDMLALKPDNESIIDDQWLVRFAINIELAVLERNGLEVNDD